jgi:hypothetical protein
MLQVGASILKKTMINPLKSDESVVAAGKKDGLNALKRRRRLRDLAHIVGISSLEDAAKRQQNALDRHVRWLYGDVDNAQEDTGDEMGHFLGDVVNNNYYGKPTAIKKNGWLGPLAVGLLAAGSVVAGASLLGRTSEIPEFKDTDTDSLLLQFDENGNQLPILKELP